jgi:hypothetical protein
MKKSKLVSLVLITAALATCDKVDAQNGASGSWDEKSEKTEKTEKKVYMRSDTSAKYTRTHHSGFGSALLWYYAFRPYGMGSGLGYQRAGFYSGGIAKSSNIGSNSVKNGIARGGFGGRGFKAAS